jgi:WD40 repeat protein
MVAAVVGDHSVRLWRVATGEELRTFSANDHPVGHVAFRPEGKTLLAITMDGFEAETVTAWDVATGATRSQLSLRGLGLGDLFPLGLSPDGATLAVTGWDRKGPNHTVYLLAVDSGKVRLSLRPQKGRFKCLSFSPDGRRIATVSDEGRAGTAHGIRQDENQVVVWDARTGEPLQFFAAHPDATLLSKGPTSIAFAPDGKLLALVGVGSAIQLWDLARNREYLGTPEAHSTNVNRVAFAPDGRTLASASSDQTIGLWDVGAGTLRTKLRGHEANVNALAFSPDGRSLASAAGDRTVRVWDATTGKERQSFVLPWIELPGGMSQTVGSSVVFASPRILVAVGTDGRVRQWDVVSGKELADLPIRQNGQTAEPARSLVGLLVAPDSRTAVVQEESAGISIVDTASAQIRLRLAVVRERPLAFSPDGKTLAYGPRFGGMRGPPVVRLCETATGGVVREIALANEPGRGTTLNAAAFSPDARTVAVAVDGGQHWLLLFDVPTGKEIVRLEGHGSATASLAFAPDGHCLASGHSDSTVLIWDVAAANRSLADTGKPIDRATMNELWEHLRSTDANAAQAAVWRLAAAPAETLPFLKGRLTAMVQADPARIQCLIADLGRESFSAREKASQELARLGAAAEPALQAGLKKKPPLELRRRIEALLGTAALPSGLTFASLRAQRSIMVLERIGTPEARQLLESLAQGPSDASSTREAKASLERMAKRPPSKP